MVTFPNALGRGLRRKLLAGGEDRFTSLCREVLDNMRPVLAKEPRARPMMRAVQRRYPSQRSIPLLDASLEFDLRTALPVDAAGPKPQRQRISALFAALLDKRSNLQFQIGISYDYAGCPSMRTAAALEPIAAAWIACRPLLNEVLT